MFISVQFKDKNKNFRGRTYDFKLSKNIETPAVGTIIRMYREDGSKCCNATRVRVVGVKENSQIADSNPIDYDVASLDD